MGGGDGDDTAFSVTSREITVTATRLPDRNSSSSTSVYLPSHSPTLGFGHRNSSRPDRHGIGSPGSTGNTKNGDSNNNDGCKDSKSKLVRPGESPDSCEKVDDGSNNNHTMEIDASDLENHPKANCIYQKLKASGTFKNVVHKFSGKDTKFDLEFLVKQLPHDTLGLTSRNNQSENKFTIIFNKERLNNLSSLM